MGAALSIFIILSLSVFLIRVASVALRVTGLVDSSARFQALSAFTGTGFTTREAESVVNYPVRRNIVSMLMIIGNMGVVTVLATVVVSVVRTDGDVTAVIVQLAWLLGSLAAHLLDDNGIVSESSLAALDLALLATRSSEGEPVDRLVLFGPDRSHEALVLTLQVGTKTSRF